MKENNKQRAEDKSIDQLLAEYQQLENSVKQTKPKESKILDKKAAEIQELEDSIKQQDGSDWGRRDKSIYTNPYIAMVPKINSGRSKSREKRESISKDNATPEEIHEDEKKTGDEAAEGSDNRVNNNYGSSTNIDVITNSQQEQNNKQQPEEDVQKDTNTDFEFLKMKNQTSGATIDEESVEQSVRSEMPDPASTTDLEIRKVQSGSLSKSQNFGKRKGSQNSHMSKGSNPIYKPVLEHNDKLKNLGSVLGARKGSAQRVGGVRRPSGGRNVETEPNMKTVQRHVGMSPMAQTNSRLKQRKNSGNGNLQQSQDSGRVDVYKMIKRPPSQSSKNSKSSGGGMKKKPPTNQKQKQNPMISLTGGSQNRKMNFDIEKQQKESENQPEPDNEYLETMKLRMGSHLPSNTTNQSGILKNLRDKKSDDVVDKTMDSGLDSEQSSAQGGSKSNRDKDDKMVDPKLMSQSMATLPQSTEFDPENLMNGSNSNLNGTFNHSQTLNTKTPGKKPKSLMSKYANLMRQTKSSSIRNSQVGKIATSYTKSGTLIQDNFKTIDDSMASSGDFSGKIAKRKSGSPTKQLNKSPNPYGSNKSGTRKNTPKINKFQKSNAVKSPLKGTENFNIGLYGDDNNYLTKVNCEQLNLEFKWEDKYDPEKFKTENSNQIQTIEGIAGMVEMPLKTRDDEERKVNEDVCLFDDEIRKGESISEKEDASSGSGSGSDTRNNEDSLIQDFYPESNQISPQKQKNLDMQTISVDSKGLEEFSKKANIDEIQMLKSNSESETQKQERQKIDNEILSIIGSINLKALQIKNKMGFKDKKKDEKDEKDEQDKQDNKNDETQCKSEDPLSSVALDLSVDDEEGDGGMGKDNDNESNKQSDVMDQTIIIGDMEDMNIFDDIKMNQDGDSAQKPGKDEKDDDKTITFKHEEFQEFVNNLKLKHRAEIDAIMIEQATYQKIILQMVTKFKNMQRLMEEKDNDIISFKKYELQAKKYLSLNERLKVDVKYYRNQVDQLKIALIEYDRSIREKVLIDNEMMIQQLEQENTHLRKLLNIPEELFLVDPEEEKRKAAEKKRNMLKSIDDKLKNAEKKISKKQTSADIYYQQQREHGFDPFELDQEEYDMYRMSKLKDHQEMPKAMKEQVHGKIYGKMEERNYREEMRRQHEKDILEEFARAYGYDVNKHQPNPNNGEIEVEYLQAYIAQCRAEEEKHAKEQALAKQKEALKGKVTQITKQKSSENKTGTKSYAPSVKKNLTVETDNFGGSGENQSKKDEPYINSDMDKEQDDKEKEKKEKDDLADRDDLEEEDDDDDLARGEESPMTREQLEQESSNSVQSLDRKQSPRNEEGGLSQTMSSTNLKEMQITDDGQSESTKSLDKSEEKKDGDSDDQGKQQSEEFKLEQNNDQDEQKSRTYVDDDDENDSRDSEDSPSKDKQQESSKAGNLSVSTVSKHIQEHTEESPAESSSEQSPMEDPYNNMVQSMPAQEQFDDPYGSGLSMTMESFGKSKKNFNASDMFGVAAVKEDDDPDTKEQPKEETAKQAPNTRYSQFNDLDEEDERDQQSKEPVNKDHQPSDPTGKSKDEEDDVEDRDEDDDY